VRSYRGLDENWEEFSIGASGWLTVNSLGGSTEFLLGESDAIDI
jgi:hypothetical protein